MKLHRILTALAIGSFVAFTSCDSDTASIGAGMMPSTDGLTTFNEAFDIKTNSTLTGPVVANTSSCYIGSIINPETRTITTSNFLAQFHLQEDYSLPSKDLLLHDANGKIYADSCIIRIFHDKFYGDSLTAMKLTVTDLSLDNIMEEDETYYTDINPAKYVNPTPKVQNTVAYSVLDQTLSDAETSLSSGNYRAIPIHLGADYGTYILNNYYDHPEYFKNSYTFIHNVCPGFYIQHSGGVGAIVNAEVSALDVHFRYTNANNVVTKAWMRLAATEEVIQNTHYDQNFPKEMLDILNKQDDTRGVFYDKYGHPYTHIVSPAGIHTELKLDLNNIISGKDGQHYNDTLNSARFTLRRYVAEDQNSIQLPPPTELLLIRKGQSDDFFAEKRLPDNETSFISTYNATNNAYTFTNIAPLISYIRKERDAAAGVTDNDNRQAREAKWQALADKDPYWSADGDWCKFVLLPITTEYTTTSNSYYSSSQTLVGVRNDYNLRSVRLEGSQNGEVQLNVIYSRFEH